MRDERGRRATTWGLKWDNKECKHCTIDSACCCETGVEGFTCKYCEERRRDGCWWGHRGGYGPIFFWPDIPVITFAVYIRSVSVILPLFHAALGCVLVSWCTMTHICYQCILLLLFPSFWLLKEIWLWEIRGNSVFCISSGLCMLRARWRLQH